MMEGRGLSVAHTTVMRWVHQYGTKLDERIRGHLKLTNESWRSMKRISKLKVNTFIYIIQWIPKETRLIFISVEQETQRLQRVFSRNLCGPFIFLNLVSLRWIKI